MVDYATQAARAEWMTADAWDLDDAMHGTGKWAQNAAILELGSNERYCNLTVWFYT